MHSLNSLNTTLTSQAIIDAHYANIDLTFKELNILNDWQITNMDETAASVAVVIDNDGMIAAKNV